MQPDDSSIVPYSQIHLLVVIPVILLATFFAFTWSPWPERTSAAPLAAETPPAVDRSLQMRRADWTEKLREEVAEGHETCYGCHAIEDGAEKQFADGTMKVIALDLEKFRKSSHGSLLHCSDCHLGYMEAFEEEGEHPYFEGSYKAFQKKAAESCGKCHATYVFELSHGAHGAGGELTCVSCHGFHEVGGTDFNPAQSAEYCGRCHKEIAAEYADNVHARSEKHPRLLPTCAGCHGSPHRLRSVGKGPGDWGRAFRGTQCAACHRMMDRDFAAKHDFLTPLDLHLGPNLGCACHAARTGGAHILGRGNQPVSGKNRESEDLCALCHRPDGKLLPAVEAGYVIGATRTTWLDVIGIGLVVLTLAGFWMGHLGLRLVSGFLPGRKE
jgi:hypothetical protein